MPEQFETPAQLHRYCAERIEEEGLDYFLRDYVDPEYLGADKLDPELTAMWKEYVALTERILKHVGLNP